MKVVLLGLSVNSSWGGGHASNHRALIAEMSRRGHAVVLCERNVPGRERNGDLPELAGARLCLYDSVEELARLAGEDIAAADLVVVGSRLPEGVAVAEYVLATAQGRTAFHDIDTPATLAKLEAGDQEHLTPGLIPRFDLYLSFTAGPTLRLLQTRYGARHAVPFHCLVDPASHLTVARRPSWDLGYLGPYSPDRRPGLESLLLAPARALHARQFVVAGPHYPQEIRWPDNVTRIEHVAPERHPVFYGAQRFTLNLTPAALREAGWSPSVGLFEAAACGTAIISDDWPGLEEFFVPGEEIIVARSADDVLRALVDTSVETSRFIASRARQRVLREHTAAHRVDQLERELIDASPMGSRLTRV